MTMSSASSRLAAAYSSLAVGNPMADGTLVGPLIDLKAYERMQTALATVVKNLEKVPFDQVAADLRQALASLDRTLRTVDTTVARLDGRVTPELERTLAQARETLASADRAIAQVGSAAQAAQGSLGQDAAWQAELRGTLRDVSRAADQLRQLADLLNRHPQALLRGKPETAMEPPRSLRTLPPEGAVSPFGTAGRD